MSEDSTVRDRTRYDFTPRLVADIDRAIREIPPAQLSSPDHNMVGMDQVVSYDPFTHFEHLREAVGDVVEHRDGKYGDLTVYNCFGHDPSRPNFAVLGFDTIKAMVFDKANFVNGGAYGALDRAQDAGFTFVNELDGDEHRVTRRLFDQVFSREYLVNFAEDVLGPSADHLALRIRRMLEDGEPVDLCRDMALPLLFMGMSRIIGLPVTDLSYMVAKGEQVFNGPRDFEGAQRASRELDDYFSARYSERKAAGDLDQGDLMSIMSTAEKDGRRFSEREIIVYCRFILPAGIETTWRQTANICYAMMTHPDQYRQIIAAPELIPQAIEECLRWMPSGFVLPRIVARDTELAGVKMAAGSSICGVFGVANRDGRVWDSPHEFDIRRERKLHLTFSMGTHACMGQQLARQSFNHVMRALTQHLPDIVADADPKDLKTTGYVIRCPEKVPVRFA